MSNGGPPWPEEDLRSIERAGRWDLSEKLRKENEEYLMCNKNCKRCGGGLPDWMMEDIDWLPEGQLVPPGENEVDSEELVDMLKYHLFRVYNQEVQDETT